MTTPILTCEEFLAPPQTDLMWQFAMARQPDFVASEVTGADDDGRRDDDFRRSRVLYELDGVRELLIDAVMRQLPRVLHRLGMVPFVVREVELQATATGDEEWFKPHRDNGSEGQVASRTLTFVYYCHREPRRFSGGALRMFGPAPDGEAAGSAARDITPARNSVVFFPSSHLHEVTHVSCPTRRFEDSRLTYNGWLHR